MIEFDLTFVPESTKNRPRIVRKGRGGRVGIVKSAAAMRTIANIRQAVIEHLGTLPSSPVFGDDDIDIAIEYYPRESRVHVKVASIGPKPRGLTGRKRDLQNIQEGICDALQGILYQNDKQIARMRLRRNL